MDDGSAIIVLARSACETMVVWSVLVHNDFILHLWYIFKVTMDVVGKKSQTGLLRESRRYPVPRIPSFMLFRKVLSSFRRASR